MSRSPPGNGEAFHAYCRRVDAEAEFKIVRGRKRMEHVEQIACDRDFAHGIAALAVLDPEARRAATVVAGHLIDPHADQTGDLEALCDILDQGLGRLAAGHEMQV